MGQFQGATKPAASLRIVFDDGVVSVPLSAATTLSDIARAVRRMSAQRRSGAAAVAVMFSDDPNANRAHPARGYELPETAFTSFTGKERKFSQADFDA